MRDAILPNEMNVVRRVLTETGSWEEAKASVPQIDPDYLENFKESLFVEAGITEKPVKKPEAPKADDKKPADKK